MNKLTVYEFIKRTESEIPVTIRSDNGAVIKSTPDELFNQDRWKTEKVIDFTIYKNSICLYIK